MINKNTDINQLNNFKKIREHLNINESTKNFSWEANKEKASNAIYKFFQALLKELDNEDSNKMFKQQKIVNTIVYVLDKAQIQLNQGQFKIEDFSKLDARIKKNLDETVYNSLMGNSSNLVGREIFPQKKCKSLLKNIKIIVTHKNTDKFTKTPNIKTNWFDGKFTSKTHTHKKIINYLLKFSSFQNQKFVQKNYFSHEIKKDKSILQIKSGRNRCGTKSGQIISKNEHGNKITTFYFVKNKNGDYTYNSILKTHDKLKINMFNNNNFDDGLHLITKKDDGLNKNEFVVFEGKELSTDFYKGKIYLKSNTDNYIEGVFDKDFKLVQLYSAKINLYKISDKTELTSIRNFISNKQLNLNNTNHLHQIFTNDNICDGLKVLNFPNSILNAKLNHLTIEAEDKVFQSFKVDYDRSKYTHATWYTNESNKKILNFFNEVKDLKSGRLNKIFEKYLFSDKKNDIERGLLASSVCQGFYARFSIFSSLSCNTYAKNEDICNSFHNDFHRRLNITKETFRKESKVMFDRDSNLLTINMPQFYLLMIDGNPVLYKLLYSLRLNVNKNQKNIILSDEISNLVRITDLKSFLENLEIPDKISNKMAEAEMAITP